MSRLQSQVMGIDLNLWGCRWQHLDSLQFHIHFFSFPLSSFLLQCMGLLLYFLIPETKHRKGNVKHSLEGCLIKPPQWFSLASVLFFFSNLFFLMSGHSFLSLFSLQFFPQSLLFSSDSIHSDSILFRKRQVSEEYQQSM